MDFVLIGHRGARGLFPENTIEGFRATLGLGLSAVELDVGVTRDGEVVVHHDPALNPDLARGPDGAWIAAPGPLLRELTLAELRRYDVGRLRPGSATAARFPAQRPCDGACIPTLAEALRATAGARVTVEVKSHPDQPGATPPAEEMAERVAAVVASEGAEARVVVSSFDWRVLRHLRRRGSRLALSWLTCAETEAQPGLWWDRGAPVGTVAGAVPRAVAEEGGGVWSPEHADLTREAVREAQALGLAVVPWTVNEPADTARLVGWGVDGLITDRPDLAPALPERR